MGSVVVRDDDGEIYLMNEATNETLELDPVGVETWRLISRGHSVRTIRQTIYDRFDTDIDTVRRDLDAFVAALERLGMARVTG